ncbi:MAG TPA: septation protein SepH [Acidimicrobiales bacterium]|nr:septation protein SepH [Acidimicrobiales bacterium]
MQELHLVGMTRDLNGLIFSVRKGSRSGGFVVPIDRALSDTLESASRMKKEGSEPDPEGRSAVSARSGPSRRSSSPQESQLTPREMQARLRAGHSIQQVARVAGVSPEWVERFDAPVAAERSRVIETAFGMTSTKARVGESALPLADSVRVNLREKGVSQEPAAEGWSALSLDGDRWLVRYEYVSRRRPQMAEWEVDFETRTLTPRNRTATELGYVDSARRRLPPPPATPVPAPDTVPDGDDSLPATSRVLTMARPIVDIDEEEEEEAEAPRRRSPRSSAPAKKTTAKKTTARKAPVRKAPARKTTARKTTARKTTARKTTARKTTARKTTARKVTARKTPARKVTARKTTARKTTARKVTARKTPAREVRVRKAPVRKAPARKVTASNTVARKAAPRKAAPRRTTARKAVARKAAPRKASARDRSGRPRATAPAQATVESPFTRRAETGPRPNRPLTERAAATGAAPEVVIHTGTAADPSPPTTPVAMPVSTPTTPPDGVPAQRPSRPAAAAPSFQPAGSRPSTTLGAHATPPVFVRTQPPRPEAAPPATPEATDSAVGAGPRWRRFTRPIRSR